MTATKLTFEKRHTKLGHYWRSPAPPSALRACLRGLSLDRLKFASIGGEQEQGFEQAFASLAYSYLKDKSPRLLDYIVGFQLIDRNEDNTKAAGLFGFKVGDMWLYAPAFFLNGDLKGHELLYVKKQDSFVPQKENWVNHLISRKPHSLGEGSPKDAYQLGGVPPDITRMSRPAVMGKFGAYCPDVQSWAKPFLELMGAVAVKSDRLFAKHAGLAERLDLGSFLSKHVQLLSGAYDLAHRYPLLKEGFAALYGRDFFQRTARAIQKTALSLVPAGAGLSGPATARRGGGSLIDSKKKKSISKAAGVRVLTRADLRPLPPVYEGLLKGAAVDEDAPGGITQNKDREPTQKEQEQLLRDGVALRDTREEGDKSTVYDTQVRVELSNPGETGIYRVLEKPGNFDRMLIIHHPQTNRGRENYCTVVRLSDPRNWLNIHAANLWVKASPEPDRAEYKKWFDAMSGTTDLQTGTHYLAVGPNGAGTTAFCVRDRYGDDSYEVDFEDHARYGMDRPTWAKRRPYEHGLDYLADGYDYVSSYNAKLLINPREGSSLRSIQGQLSLPANFKVLKLSAPAEEEEDEDDSGSLIKGKRRPDGAADYEHPVADIEGPDEHPVADIEGPGEGHGAVTGSARGPIEPGNLADIQLFLHEKTAELRVVHTGTDVWLKAGASHLKRHSPTAALISLVREHGCSEADARAVLKSAAAKGSGAWRIKQAEPNTSALAGGPTAPAVPEPLMGTEPRGYNSMRTIYPQEQQEVVPGLEGSRTDPMIYDPFYQPDQGAMQMAQEAAGSGQKEVFDTAMISGMLKAVRQDSLVDRYLGDLMKALDKLGRILFMFYWHQEEFEDRYGKADLPELEDSLRNAFEVLGDVVLFLKEKTVGGGTDEVSSMSGQAAGEPDIEEAARN